jgi:hypothetical protein
MAVHKAEGHDGRAVLKSLLELEGFHKIDEPESLTPSRVRFLLQSSVGELSSLLGLALPTRVTGVGADRRDASVEAQIQHASSVERMDLSRYGCGEG